MHGYSLNPVQSQKYALNTKEPAEPQSEMAGVLFFGLVRSVSHCWITPNRDRLALLVRAFLFWRLPCTCTKCLNVNATVMAAATSALRAAAGSTTVLICAASLRRSFTLLLPAQLQRLATHIAMIAVF